MIRNINMKSHNYIRKGILGLSLVMILAATTSCAAKDATPPVLQLIGSDPAPLALGASGYDDPGAIAIDDVDGNMGLVYSEDIVSSSAVGEVTITYSATDKAGNTGSVTRTVNVVDRLAAASIPQFVTPLLIPPVMPTSTDPNPAAGTDYYEIAMRQFEQQILPAPLPKTTVWGYGSATDPKAIFNAPSLTIEATADKPTRIKWINDLKDANGNYLPHLLPIDQTLHWANPNGGDMMRDTTGVTDKAYVGPVPIVTHVHGAHVVQESDGYPEAWYLPDAAGIPDTFAKFGSSYDKYKSTAQSGSSWTAGNAVFDYTNDQRASTLWYHDHALGMTRTNVYAGPAGFYLIRGGAGDAVTLAGGTPAVLPGPAPGLAGTYADADIYEIPIAIQDRSFNSDGSLFYPDSRAQFDEYQGAHIPDPTSDIAPIWNPEVFGDTIIVNGNTWPTLDVQPKKYRFRFLNGAQARTFILGLDDITTPANNSKLSFWQIGSDGGFLSSPASLNELLMMPAERADVIVDFSKATVGDSIILTNKGPDDPFQGGVPGTDFTPADPNTTGKVMQFKVVASDGKADPSSDPAKLILPAITQMAPTPAAPVRKLSLNELSSDILFNDPETMLDPFGPRQAQLGTVNEINGVITGVPQLWMNAVTENIKLNDTEVWEIYNFTADAHPIHLHLVEFQVINRQAFDAQNGILGNASTITKPPAWETGYKDTVMSLPGTVTRIKAKFDREGHYVWHCHILEHEDNEMMRPFEVIAPGKDKIAPVITLNSPERLSVKTGTTYTDATATAVDDVDGAVTVSVSGMVDTTAPGLYMLKYTATDAAGNSSGVMKSVYVIK